MTVAVLYPVEGVFPTSQGVLVVAQVMEFVGMNMIEEVPVRWKVEAVLMTQLLIEDLKLNHRLTMRRSAQEWTCCILHLTGKITFYLTRSFFQLNISYSLTYIREK